MGAEQARPWWASDDPGVDELVTDEDPVTAHRTARRSVPTDATSAPGDGEPAPDPGRGAPSAGATHDPSTCGLCPVCVGLRLLGEHRPEVIDHLNEASRHLSAALRGLLEPRVGTPGGDRAPADRFERIEVDGPDRTAEPSATADQTAVDDRGSGVGPA